MHVMVKGCATTARGLIMEWVSVKERLPSDVECIVYGTPTCATCGNKPVVMQARYREDTKNFEFGEYDCGLKVTHWMPLPEAPKD